MQFTYSLNRLYDNSTLIGQLLQDNTYKYDNAGNIISIDDNGLNTRNQYFEYDNLNRLIYSMGDMNCQGTGIGYETDYTYSIAGRLLKKNVTSQRMSTTVGVYPVDYRNSYAYPSSGNTFAVRSVQDALSGSVNNFDWDANGNLIRSVCGSPVHDRHPCWTEDSRLQGYWELSDNDGGIAAYYGYAAGGDRNYKLTSPRIHASQNASNLMQHPTLIYPTLYASSIITFHKGGYTKHYFEGANRVCSKIGGGFHHVHWGNIEDRVPALAEDYDQQSEGQREGVERTFNECLGMGVDLDGIIDLYDVVKHEAERDDPEPAFHYHSDHLGSAAYLTNDAGQVTQTLNYLPYGEDWVDVQNYAETRYPRLGIYAYNGKERDYESGFHYYGTRYYWSEVLTGWLSVDPMMDKYPSVSPYAYCVWSPVILVDPDGKKIRLVTGTDDEGNQTTVDINSTLDFPDDERMNIIREMYKTAEGKEVIDEIMKSEIVFTILEKMEDIEDHEVSPNGDVSWGNPSETHGGDANHVLAEELYHCFQIATNKWKFDGSMSKNDMYDCEIKAKTFAASLFSYNSFWCHPNGSYVPTQMYIMAGNDNNFKKSYLKNDVTTTLPRYCNNPTWNPLEQPCGEYLHRGAY